MDVLQLGNVLHNWDCPVAVQASVRNLRFVLLSWSVTVQWFDAVQCLSDHTERFTAYIMPAMASRNRTTRMPVRLRSSMCGSEAQARNSTTSEACWSRVDL